MPATVSRGAVAARRGAAQPKVWTSGRAADRRDAGTAGLELVLLGPLLIVLIFTLVQTALVWNARHLAGAAAQHGARLARAAAVAGGVDSAAAAPGGRRDDEVSARTLEYLRQVGGHALTAPTVAVSRGSDVVTVTVTGTVTGVLPGSTVMIRSQSRSPVERFRP